jgi:glycosyltransferase involved in cell wall biosynthesis
MNSPKIAAIICTHNRDRYLGAAIDSLLAQDYGDFEVLVIDNASNDQTEKVVQERLDNPRLRYIYEPTLGLSVARNRGARETNAPILAYLDDDAVASLQWLRVFVAAFDQQEKLSIAGGRVSLILPEGRTMPNWLSQNLAGALGYYNLGDEIVLITEPGLTPRGLNYAIRRSFLEKIGGFDPNLGRVGKNLLSNEELYMTELALNDGWQVAYLPEALAQHNVSPERLEPSWFVRRSWWQGVSECYREELAGRTGLVQFRRGGERFLRGLYKSIKFMNKPAERFDNLLYAYCQIGYLGRVIKTIVGGK